MYKEHPSFKSVDENTKIWRFMDFAKFCDVLEKNSLFFVKPNCFEDPWEGHLPKKHYDETSYEDVLKDHVQFIIRTDKIMTERAREDFAINCWHISDFESEAFWKKYSERGIAIQTTFGRLKESFKDNDHYEIFIGKVEYMDHNTDFIDTRNAFNQILWKRKSFEYENELRAVIWQIGAREGKGARDFDVQKGQEVNLDLSVLVENIYTTPFEKDEWFNSLVHNLIQRYGFNFPCIKSDLMDKP